MSSRGLLFVRARDEGDTYLARAKAALASVHPELPVHEVVLQRPFAHPLTAGFRVKALADSPFTTTLALDATAVVLDRLDYVFTQAERWGMACPLSPFAERALSGPAGRDDRVRLDPGLLAFNTAFRPVLNTWFQMQMRQREGAGETWHYRTGATLAEALEQNNRWPFILPAAWHMRENTNPYFFGPVKVWNGASPPPEAVDAARERYADGRRTYALHDVTQNRDRVLGDGNDYILRPRLSREDAPG